MLINQKIQGQLIQAILSRICWFWVKNINCRYKGFWRRKRSCWSIIRIILTPRLNLPKGKWWSSPMLIRLDPVLMIILLISPMCYNINCPPFLWLKIRLRKSKVILNNQKVLKNSILPVLDLSIYTSKIKIILCFLMMMTLMSCFKIENY
jgi:hypothetical protein